MEKTILIVEDETNIVDILSFNLEREGYNTIEAYDGQTGLQLAREQNPDLILLDLMLPKMNGFDVCRQLRADGSAIPIIMLTAREEERDRVMGLELGADDYVSKPFSVRELMARVRTNLRRQSVLASESGESGESSLIRAGRLTVDTEKLLICKDGRPMDVTQREYELLTFLASHPGKVYSRTDLMEQVWNYGYVGDDVRTVDVTVRRLREKIEDDPANPVLILTRRGVGYYFAAQ